MERVKQPFKISNSEIRSGKLTRSYTIVQISDLHNHLYGEKQSWLVSAVLAPKPDFVVCTGDLFNRHKATAHQNAFTLIDELVPHVPVYVVEGNHEAALNETGERYLKAIADKGAILLRNAETDVEDLHIIGLKQRASREELTSRIRPKRFNLVLCHRPELFPDYAGSGADLILCGHAHGGQIRIGNVALFAPGQGIFPKYTSGLYKKQGTTMYVSRGLGDTELSLRIHNPHELCVFRLSPA